MKNLPDNLDDAEAEELRGLPRNKNHCIVFELRGAVICFLDLGAGHPTRQEHRESPAKLARAELAHSLDEVAWRQACSLFSSHYLLR